MNSFTKKIITLAFFAVVSAASFAQQITKFAVVDTSRVYQAYFRNSAPVRNYESKKAEFQNEVTKRTEELQKLHDRRIEASKKNDQATVTRLETEIASKQQFLQEYTNAKNMELVSLQKSLQSNDSFYKNLQSKLSKIAEGGGYSVILSLQQANGVLWYSKSVDITDQVISELGL